MASILKKIRTLWANNSRILSIQNAKFSGHHFSINANIWRDFQICISVPLRTWEITVFSGFRKFSNALRLRYLWVKTPVSYEIMIMKRQSKISRTKWRALSGADPDRGRSRHFGKGSRSMLVTWLADEENFRFQMV